MKCSEIRNRLSEYMDDLLDGEDRIQVEQHLAACKDCQQELASLKALVEDLGSLRSVKAPEDFLEGIHEGLRTEGEPEKTRWTWGLFRKLFVPWKLKIPMELAAAAAVVVLVIAVTRVEQPQQHLEETFQMPQAVQDMQSDAAPETVAPVKEVPKSMPAPAAKLLSAGKVERTQGPIQLSLVLKSETASNLSPSSFDALEQAAPSPQFGGKESTMDAAPVTRMSTEAPYDIDEKSAEEREAKTRIKKESAPRLSSSHQGLLKIKMLLENAGGTVLSTEYDRQTGNPASVLAEVPSHQFGTLVKKLEKMGDLQTPSPQPEMSAPVVRIRLRLVSSDPCK